MSLISKNEFHIQTVSENIIADIELEIEDLISEIDNKETQNSFVAAAEQLKSLLKNMSIKKTPCVSMFYKGYVGLIWDAKDGDSVYLYSISGIENGKLFYNKVGKNRSETRTENAEKEIFAKLIKEINLMV
jgi:hypothetical protein